MASQCGCAAIRTLSTVSAMSPEDRMSRGLVMSQSIENNIISTVFIKVKRRLRTIGVIVKLSSWSCKNGQRVDH